ncbi:TRAP transporter [Alkalihalobacterium alkalinitrilicum]|uniref:TRAP transporter n=1 Tax=Alkalihalobacterium alkalinitrilicum TaxID=427920 RepID=UPI0009952DC1|nr:TRAP transporter [Alkalihalobacterium alkalinitrilicum]
MLKKEKFWLSCLFTMLVLFLTACGGSSETSNQGNNEESDSNSNEETITLIVASGLSTTHAMYEGFYGPWMERVTEETNGRVQFEFFPSGELVEITQKLEGLRQGIADIAAPMLTPYDPQRFPMSEVTMLPLLESDTYIASRAFKKLLDSDVPVHDGKTFYELEFADKDVFALPIGTTQEYVISTTGHAFNSLSDISGTTLRTPSRITELFATNAELGTVTMAAVEMFDALSRGAFEGSFFSIADWTGYGFQDLFKYSLTGVNFGHFNAVLAFTQEKWDSLPEDVREIMLAAAADLVDSGAAEYENRSDIIMAENIENGGKFVDINDIDPEVKDHFLAGIEQTWYDYIDLLEERGIEGKPLVKLWRDLIVEEGAVVPDAIMELE